MEYIVRAIIEYSRESVQERDAFYDELKVQMGSKEKSIVKIIKIEKIEK